MLLLRLQAPVLVLYVLMPFVCPSILKMTDILPCNAEQVQLNCNMCLLNPECIYLMPQPGPDAVFQCANKMAHYEMFDWMEVFTPVNRSSCSNYVPSPIQPNDGPAVELPGTSTGLIIGMVFGFFGFVLAMLLLVYFRRRLRHRARSVSRYIIRYVRNEEQYRPLFTID